MFIRSRGESLTFGDISVRRLGPNGKPPESSQLMLEFLARRSGTWPFGRRVLLEFAALDQQRIMRRSIRIRISQSAPRFLKTHVSLRRPRRRKGGQVRVRTREPSSPTGGQEKCPTVGASRVSLQATRLYLQPRRRGSRRYPSHAASTSISAWQRDPYAETLIL